MLRPLGDRVLVRPIYPEPPKSESGIEIVQNYDPPVTTGTVAIRPAFSKCPTCEAKRPPQFAEGTQVIFSPAAGEEVQIYGEVLIMLREQDILAVVEE